MLTRTDEAQARRSRSRRRPPTVARQNVVLGAGITGIAAAYSAATRGRPCVVYEASDRPGGLVDNFSIDGFRFDNAVHVSFATEPEVRAIFDRTPYRKLFAETWCWDAGTWLRHPVQNNLHPLPADEKVDLIAGLINRPDLDVRTYRDWLLFQYGEPIARRWPLRYTEKYWSVPAEQLGVSWIKDRMRRADIREILHGAMSSEAAHTYYLGEVRYPEKGGYRAFIEPMLPDCDIRCSHRAVAVDPDRRLVRFASGAEVSYRELVSTLPLPAVVSLIADVPAEIRAAADSLFATSVDLISVGFRRADVAKYLWCYIYDTDILAARAYSPSLKSPDNVPDGCSSLQFEIYSSPRRPQTASPAELKANCVMALERLGLAIRDDIVVLHHKRLPYGNVVFDLGMEECRDRVRAWLGKRGIITAGRFGEWDYLWSHQSLLSGRRAAEAF